MCLSEAHAFRSSKVCFEDRKFKASFVAKFGNSSANFGTSQLTLEKFGKSYVKSTVVSDLFDSNAQTDDQIFRPSLHI